MQCSECGQAGTQTQDGWWICYAASASPDRSIVKCPQCAARLAPVGSEWYRCGGCGYEIAEDAARLHVELAAAFEADPGQFFKDVEARRDAIRALEPVWHRR